MLKKNHLFVLLLAPFVGCADDSMTDEARRHVDDDRNPAPFDPSEPYTPDFDASETSANVTHRFYPLPVGASWTYRNVTDEGTEIIHVDVLSGTRTIFGAPARIVHDVARIDNEVIEDTTDWFTQDDDRNVWYLGEDTTAYSDGGVSHEGSWMAGVDGALPGVVMLGRPRRNDVYRQEYFAGHAEDYAEVIRFGATVTVPAGTFHHCLQTRDRSAIDPAADEIKTYCPDVGLVLTEEGGTREELIAFSGLPGCSHHK